MGKKPFYRFARYNSVVWKLIGGARYLVLKTYWFNGEHWHTVRDDHGAVTDAPMIAFE